MAVPDQASPSSSVGSGLEMGGANETLTLTLALEGEKEEEEQRRKLEMDLRELEDMLCKLNPLAEEFVPPSSIHSPPKKKSVRKQQRRRQINLSVNAAQQEDSIRRTVYVSDIDHQVTEEQLAALFMTCGQVADCRICGDAKSVLRFAFVEFIDEEAAKAALSLTGMMLGFYPVRVFPSKTAIIPVDPDLLPRSEYEREMCSRTVYCTNIDKNVSQADVKLFFEVLCGKVARLRLLGDYHHSTRIAFVEFVLAGSAITALNCSGAVLGSLQIRCWATSMPVSTKENSTCHDEKRKKLP